MTFWTHIPSTKYNFKWIKDLNIRLDITDFLEENTGGKKNYATLILAVVFFNIPPKAQETEAKPYLSMPNKRLLQSKEKITQEGHVNPPLI